MVFPDRRRLGPMVIARADYGRYRPLSTTCRWWGEGRSDIAVVAPGSLPAAGLLAASLPLVKGNSSIVRPLRFVKERPAAKEAVWCCLTTPLTYGYVIGGVVGWSAV